MTLRKYGSPPKKGRSKPAKQENMEKEVFSKGIVRSGTRMTPQSGNIGGRVMIMQAMKSHNARLKKTSSSVDTSKPWGYDKLKHTPTGRSSAKKVRPSSRSRGRPKSRGRPSSKSSTRSSRRGTRPSPSSRSHHPSHPESSPHHHQQQHQQGGGVDPFFDLLPHQRDIYDKFVEMLTAVGTGKLRFVATQAAADAEERLLLSDYTGIDNYFDRMLEPHRADMQSSTPPTRVQPQMQHTEAAPRHSVLSDTNTEDVLDFHMETNLDAPPSRRYYS